MEGILIGTAVLWVLNAVLVTPLTAWSVQRAMAAEGIQGQSLDALDEDQKNRWAGKTVGYYVLWDVIVLGVAGLIGGLLGFYFIGVSLEAKGWPGMLAFIGISFVGAGLAGVL